LQIERSKLGGRAVTELELIEEIEVYNNVKEKKEKQRKENVNCQSKSNNFK